MTSRRSSEALSEADADALLSGRATTGHDELREIIGLMRTASAVPAPPPTAALAAVLNDGFDPLPVESTQVASRWGRWSVRITAATTAAMLTTFGAATANALPAPVQTAVASVVGAVTPLELPRPSPDARTRSDDQGGPSGQPPAVPSEQPTAETAADEPSGKSADATAVPPETAPPGPKAPAVVTPPRRPEATATTADEPDVDEPDADVQESDETDTDEPEQPEPSGNDADVQERDQADTDEPEQPEPSGNDADVQERDQADTDEPEQPESGEIEQGDADDRDLLDPGEPELDGDGPEQDEPDEEA